MRWEQKNAGIFLWAGLILPAPSMLCSFPSSRSCSLPSLVFGICMWEEDMHVWGSEVNTRRPGCLLEPLSTLVFEKRSLTKKLAWLAGLWALGSACLHVLLLNCSQAWLFNVGPGDLNSGPHTVQFVLRQGLIVKARLALNLRCSHAGLNLVILPPQSAKCGIIVVSHPTTQLYQLTLAHVFLETSASTSPGYRGDEKRTGKSLCFWKVELLLLVK